MRFDSNLLPPKIGGRVTASAAAGKKEDVCVYMHMKEWAWHIAFISLYWQDMSKGKIDEGKVHSVGVEQRGGGGGARGGEGSGCAVPSI